MDTDIFQIANEVRILKDLKITKMAAETNINRGNLNAWLNAGSPDRLSSDKIKIVFDYLEIDLDPLRLRPGIHRFTIPGPTSNSVAWIESVIFKFFPDGGTFYLVQDKSRTSKIDEVSFSPVSWKRWVAVPKFAHDIRVIFKMGEKAKYYIYHYMNEKDLPSPFMSGVCDWHGADSRILLSGHAFAQLSSDESLTVSELDKILFNPPSSDYLWTGDSIAAEDQLETEYDSRWTWERLVSSLKEQGKTPGEVAKRLGL